MLWQTKTENHQTEQFIVNMHVIQTLSDVHSAFCLLFRFEHSTIRTKRGQEKKRTKEETKQMK